MAYDPKFNGNDPTITAAVVAPTPSIIIPYPTSAAHD